MSLYEGMFSQNQKSYRTRLVIVLNQELVHNYNREEGLETNLAAQRLASYHFKQKFEQDNNFLN